MADLSFSDQFSPLVVRAVQDSITTSLALIKDRWQTDVQKKLHSTIPLYLMGLDFNSIIYPFEGNAFTGAVELHGKLPNMLETGFGAFDMKTGFSKSKHITRKKDGGWYLTIPFRHSVPGSFMYGKPMSKDLYKQASSLKHKERLSFPGAGAISWTGYQHKNKIKHGLTRIIKQYNKTSQSQYLTWRRVSDKSDPKSWMHPGYKGVKIAKSLETYAQDTLVKLLRYNLNNL